MKLKKATELQLSFVNGEIKKELKKEVDNEVEFSDIINQAMLYAEMKEAFEACGE